MKTNAALNHVFRACALLFLAHLPLTAAPGDPDWTFQNGGRVITGNGGGYDLAVQADGKVVVAGFSYNGANYDFSVVRHLANGSPDPAFNGSGRADTAVGSGNDIGRSVAIQADGKILVAGYATSGLNDIALVRYHANGTLDTTFHGTGKVLTDFGGNELGSSVAVQSDGKILVAGTADGDFAVVRYEANGSLDTTFNGTGKVTTDFGGSETGTCMAVQPDGKIVVAGTNSQGVSTDNVLVARYLANGSLDTTFNGTGKATARFASTTPLGVSLRSDVSSLALQGDGKILVLGTGVTSPFNPYGFSPDSSVMELARFGTGGTLDATFGYAGIARFGTEGYEEGKSVAVQNDGRILIAGTSAKDGKTKFVVARYHADGSPDPTFVCTDKGTTDVASSVAVQGDGKILVAGYTGTYPYYGFVLARYLVADGLRNPGYGTLQDHGYAPWYYNAELGWLYFWNDGQWAYSDSLKGWLNGDDKSPFLWSVQFQWLYESGDGDNWYSTSTIGWIHIGNYGGWVWSQSYGWVWPHGDGTYYYSATYGWLYSSYRWPTSTGAAGIWSYTYNRWL